MEGSIWDANLLSSHWSQKLKTHFIIGEFRPISLIGYLYKIIVKTLAIRLKRVIGLNIDKVQFVEGRSILDGLLIVNEICSWAKQSKKQVLIFKADFDKAFDSINLGVSRLHFRSNGLWHEIENMD